MYCIYLRVCKSDLWQALIHHVAFPLPLVFFFYSGCQCIIIIVQGRFLYLKSWYISITSIMLYIVDRDFYVYIKTRCCGSLSCSALNIWLQSLQCSCFIINLEKIIHSIICEKRNSPHKPHNCSDFFANQISGFISLQKCTTVAEAFGSTWACVLGRHKAPWQHWCAV